MKITTPQDLKHSIESAIAKIEVELKTEVKDKSQYDIRILGEFTKDLQKEIEKEYVGAGWKKAKCTTIDNPGGLNSTNLKLTR